ncbi:hypothetical protein N9L19_00870 [bacterium]|nr:hypothetical protein [bacterium]
MAGGARGRGGRGQVSLKGAHVLFLHVDMIVVVTDVVIFIVVGVDVVGVADVVVLFLPTSPVMGARRNT